MINIAELIEQARTQHYEGPNAEAKVCQDLILAMINNSQYKRNITVKGGVVMRNITGNSRRATLDMDIDFIKYSLSDDSIDRFISSLNVDSSLSVLRVGEIEELRQQDYRGKQAYVELHDSMHNSVKSKIDFGVHKHLDIEQEEYCFDVGMNSEGVSLLINSKEQMLTEKLRSLLKFGQFSTRFKDVFDIYYLLETSDNEKLKYCLKALIYDDSGMRENNIDDIIRRLESVFANKLYVANLMTSKKNWLDKPIDEVLTGILNMLK